MNVVIMSGNLGRDPETRYTTGAQQQAICRFPIAVNDGYKDKQQTTWVNIVSFGRTAENCEKFLSKGRKVLVNGRLQIRRYQKQDGSEGMATEVIANSIEFLNSQNEQQAPGWGQQVQQTQQAWTQEVQFQTPETYGKPSQVQQPQWSAWSAPQAPASQPLVQQADQQTQQAEQQTFITPAGFAAIDEDTPF